eukprot:5167834-Amphidinium_carterae.1
MNFALVSLFAAACSTHLDCGIPSGIKNFPSLATQIRKLHCPASAPCERLSAKSKATKGMHKLEQRVVNTYILKKALETASSRWVGRHSSAKAASCEMRAEARWHKLCLGSP